MEYFNLHSDYINLSAVATLEEINENSDKPWDYKSLSKNPNVTIKFILEHKNEKWDYAWLTNNNNISIKDILDNPELPWYYKSRCFSGKIDDVLEWPQYPWNFETLSRFIKFKDIIKHPELPWDYKEVRYNYTVNLIDMLQHPEIQWDCSVLGTYKLRELREIVIKINKLISTIVYCDDIKYTIFKYLGLGKNNSILYTRIL